MTSGFHFGFDEPPGVVGALDVVFNVVLPVSDSVVELLVDSLLFESDIELDFLLGELLLDSFWVPLLFGDCGGVSRQAVGFELLNIHDCDCGIDFLEVELLDMFKLV